MKTTMIVRCAVVLFAILATTLGEAGAHTIRIGGTGAPLAALRHLGDAFATWHPGAVVHVLPSMGSSGGLRALGDGAIDLAISARPPREDEAANAALTVFPFVATPLVVVTSHDDQSGLGITDVTAMFAGDLAAWPDGLPVRAILRPETESDVRILTAAFPELEAAFAAARRRPEVPVATDDQQNMELAATIVGSLTFGTLLQVRSEDVPLHVLPLNGVEPSIEALEAGQYPVVKQFFLVVRADARDVVHEFVAFARSDAALAIMRRLGAAPGG